jgi:hypothetical protein
VDDEAPPPVRIPADIDRDDQILGPLTARQTAILAAAALALWLGYLATRTLLAPLAYLALVAPVAAVTVAVALGRRDGMPLDRFLLAGLRHRAAPRRRVLAPEGVPELPGVIPAGWARAAGPGPAPLELPCRAVTGTGAIDLGPDGWAGVAVCGTVSFGLLTPAEQQALTGAFGRWLNSLTGPVQLLVQAHRLDVNPLVSTLSATAGALPHPALEQAALAHAAFLADLAAGRDLLSRRVLLVVREPATGPAGEDRVRHRITEAARALGAADVTVTPLDGPATAHALTAPEDS